MGLFSKCAVSGEKTKLVVMRTVEIRNIEKRLQNAHSVLLHDTI